MDTRSQSKISTFFLLCITLILIACGFTVSLESVMPQRGYIEDNTSIKEDVLRLAKNLQRYYIYYKNFDPDAAVDRLNAVYRYKSQKTADASSPTYDIYGRSIEDDLYSDSKSSTAEKDISDIFASSASIPYPEELYETDYTTLSDDDLALLEKNLSEAIENYKSVEEYLAAMHDMHFYVYDKTRNICIATNAEDIFNEKYYDYTEISRSLFDEQFTGEALNASFARQNYICIISIPVAGISKQMQQEINFTYRVYSANKVISSIYLPAIFYILGFTIFAFLLLTKRSELANIRETMFGYYTAFPLTLKFIFLIISVMYMYRLLAYESYILSQQIVNMYLFSVALRVITVAAAFVVFIMAGEHFYKYCRRQMGLKDEAETKIVASCIRDIKMAAKANEQIVVCVSVFLLVIAFLPIPALIIYASATTPLPAILALCIYCLYVLAIWVIYKYINNMSKLRYYISEMAKGNISSIPEEKGLFSKPINNLNNINAGLKANLEEMIKSERLKTELITNVSHDLKTPLTSIINYLMLLKTLNIENEQAKEYIDIANDKARRLNILILDLFEASKLNSGQMKLEKIPSDVVALLSQTLGELDYKISQSGIEFKSVIPNHPIILDMDGQRMWRVFDNLLTNILKYSPEGSRGYINLDDHENEVVITFKNVSSYPLDFDGAELFERFKRGDVSRSTEGSGLGLSIAKSIVELHGGTLEIVIDGDLFKAIVTLPKQKEETTQGEQP